MSTHLIYQMPTAIFANQHHAIFEGTATIERVCTITGGALAVFNNREEHLLHCPPPVRRHNTTWLFLETIVRAWKY